MTSAQQAWHPIAPLSDADWKIDLAAMGPLYESWRASKQRLEQASPARLREFNERLVRRLSVETGILERLYDLDRGTTEALVTHGFVEDLVSRANTGMEPATLVEVLRDQEAATHLVMDCVAQNRELSKGLIHELHTILTRHQATTVAIDPTGQRHEIPLLKGKFKEQPNNPKRPNGSVHEYCPPVHVTSEIENLLAWLASYSNEDPVIVATWLHHRFTQIHPYQDGNGRLARTLATMVLLRAQLLPLVIDRDLRQDYIAALEKADQGNLRSLAELFASIERTAILQALSVDVDAEISHQKTLTSAVIDSLAEKFGKRRQAQRQELRHANDIAEALRSRALLVLQHAFEELRKPVTEVGAPDMFVAAGGPDHGNAHWYRSEVIQSANKNDSFANFNEAHFFVKASMRVGMERLVFVTSFHHVGRELSGIMEAVAFSQIESYENSDDPAAVSRDFIVCSLQPFVFTYLTKEAEIGAAFARWLDAALAIAVKEFGDRL